MIVVLIRRCVKPEEFQAFVDSYKNGAPKKGETPGFISETLTRISDDQLNEPMQSLNSKLRCDNCTTYLNIAYWESKEAFQQFYKPETTHDPTYECSNRLRAVMDIVETNP